MATGGAALARFKGRVIEVFDVVKPADLIHALHLAKNGSKLSPLFANTCELDLTLELNAEAAWPQGKWVRQDPTFPEVIFDSEEITPTPGIEIKVWFPLTTEITGRFKESVSRFAQDQTNIAVLAWLPEHILYGKPVILDVWIDSARSVAMARDKHYHNPPDYLIIEPEDTSARTRNLRQTNTTGYKFQDTPELLVRAKEVMEQLGIEAEFAFTAEYQRKLKELRSKFTYRSDSNFSKIDRIGHEGLEAFKTRVLNTTLAGRTINEWRTVFRSAARSDNARAAINGLIGLRNHGWS
ncbi:MAG TPA: hypothetical protein VFA26_16070 [Gemmataceae bacterium]|nr:hypothetical protein [Gemmataceae bacterium]